MSYVATNILMLIALLSVAFVLCWGLFNMMRDGSPNLSQTLMRWRVGLQFVAVVIIMTVMWVRA
jgi:hypothetical protein